VNGPWYRSALGNGREPSPDQIGAIEAPATGRRSVDAGAGTGKTSTLALRALYLIETEQVRAPEIVVVTFTRKAAAEIGSRIADTIDRAIAAGARFEGDGRGVRCTTIHALAAEIRREFAFDFGFAAPPRGITDGEAYAIFHDAFRALLDNRLNVNTGAFPIAEISLSQLEHDLGKLALRLKNYGISPEAFAAGASAEAERFGAQSWGQMWYDGTGRNVGIPKGHRPKECVAREQRASEAEREIANIAVVRALFEEFDRRLAARGAATYGDLIFETTRLLHAQPEIVKRLRGRYRYVLLDESQDTSDLQLAFLETVFGEPGDADAAGMMPVGDIRQAIYGFNGADEHVMKRIAAVAHETLPLVVNRRSPQEIVDAAHAVLLDAKVIDADVPRLEAFAGSAGLGCVRLQSFGEAGGTVKDHVESEAKAIAREIERLLSDPAIRPSDIAILVRRRTHAATYVRELNERNVSAALDRRSGLFVAPEIRDALAWMSLLVNISDRQAAVRILQSPVCGLNDAATIALAKHGDWLARILEDRVEATIDADTRSRLEELRLLLVALLPAVALPLPLAIARILATVPIAASYVRIGEMGGAAMIGAQAIVNLRSLEVLAQEFASERPGARLADFVADAKRRILYEDDPQEVELDLDGVRVLTIHQAKGLEWPYVFVACSTKVQYGITDPTDSVVKYDMARGAFALKNDMDGRETFHWLCVSNEHDAETGECPELSERKKRAEREQARVFYVALTRAKRCVYITAPAPKTSGEATYLASIRAWAQACEPGVDLRFDLNGSATPSTRSAALPMQLVSERSAAVARSAASTFRPRVSFTAISTFETCPRMARLRYRLLLPDLRETRPRFVGLDGNTTAMTPSAARFGSLVHRALELWGRSSLERGSLAGAPLEVGDAFESARLEFADVREADAVRARATVARAVDALAGYALLAVEEPFELAVGRTRVEGAVDLIARAEDGRVVVIDYKTGRTAGEHYALQLALYRRVAESRYAGGSVDAAILRLTPESATLEFAPPLPPSDLESTIDEVGHFESDIAKVGVWCETCAYRGSPCMAPLAKSVAAQPRRYDAEKAVPGC
jgi:ATP-dependent exoDNAse (exonuclease V) beta subunit